MTTIHQALTENQRVFFESLRNLCRKHKVVISGEIGEQSPWVLFADQPDLAYGGLLATSDYVAIHDEIITRRNENVL